MVKFILPFFFSLLKMWLESCKWHMWLTLAAHVIFWLDDTGLGRQTHTAITSVHAPDEGWRCRCVGWDAARKRGACIPVGTVGPKSLMIWSLPAASPVTPATLGPTRMCPFSLMVGALLFSRPTSTHCSGGARHRTTSGKPSGSHQLFT